MSKRAILSLMTSLSLAGCGSMSSMVSGKTGCLSEDGQATAVGAIKESIEKRVAENNNTEDEGVPKSKIRAALEQVKFLFEDVRTTKEDPNSTKKFCAGKLKVVFPDEFIADASKVAELASTESFAKRAEELGAERDANAFRFDTDFSVQPTDDGQKVYAEVEDAAPTTNFIADMVAGHLFRKKVERVHREAEESVRAQQEQEQSALNEQHQAAYEEAKATNDLAEQSINAAWGALPGDLRDRALPIQRAWIKRKDADCKVEAAGTSTDPTERETSRLQCQARMNNERAGEIKELLQRTSYQPAESL